MPNLFRALLLCLTSSSTPASAQAEPQWIPAPMPVPMPIPVPAPNAAPLPTDPVRTGIQFHGEIQGGTTGFGPSASVGIGFNRVAILVTPGLLISSAVLSASLGLSVRIYFKSRQQGALLGFLRPEVLVGVAGSPSFGSTALFGGIGGGAGGEYLLTRNLGFTAELGLRYMSNTLSLSTIASLGIMLHQ